MEEELAQASINRGDNVIYVSHASEMSGKLPSKSCYLILTDSCFYIRYGDGFLKEICISWFAITSISFTNTLFAFKSRKYKLEFKIDSVDALKETIYDILPRLFTTSELCNIGISKFSDINTFPTELSALIRLKEKAKLKHIKLPSKFVAQFVDILRYSEPDLNITKLTSEPKLVEILLDVIPFCKSIKYLVVKSLDNWDVYSNLAKFILNYSSICTIEIRGPITSSFGELLQSVLKQKLGNLKNIIFAESHLNQNQLEDLVYFLRDTRIVNIGFKDAIGKNGIRYFYDSFFKQEIGSDLTMITLNNTQSLNVNSILRHTPNIQILSIENCNLEIATVLTIIGQTNLPFLKAINISRNKCTFPSAQTVNLPASLNTIKIDRIAFKDQTLAQTLQTLFRSVAGELCLSMSDTSASSAEWARAFNYLRRTRFTALQSLVWNGNPTHKFMAGFLAKNRALGYLEMRGCLSESDAETVAAFTNFISEANWLRTLKIVGTKDNFVGSFLPSLLLAVELAKRIECVDFSNSYAGSKAYPAFIRLIKADTALAILTIDGVRPSSLDSLNNFINTVMTEGIKTALDFPVNDLSLFDLTQEEFLKIRRKFEFPCGNSSSPFDMPFLIFKDKSEPTFPNYIDGDSYLAPPGRADDARSTGAETYNSIIIGGRTTGRRRKQRYSTLDNSLEVTPEPEEIEKEIEKEKRKEITDSKQKLTNVSVSKSSKRKERNEDDKIKSKIEKKLDELKVTDIQQLINASYEEVAIFDTPSHSSGNVSNQAYALNHSSEVIYNSNASKEQQNEAEAINQASSHTKRKRIKKTRHGKKKRTNHNSSSVIADISEPEPLAMTNAYTKPMIENESEVSEAFSEEIKEETKEINQKPQNPIQKLIDNDEKPHEELPPAPILNKIELAECHSDELDQKTDYRSDDLEIKRVRRPTALDEVSDSSSSASQSDAPPPPRVLKKKRRHHRHRSQTESSEEPLTNESALMRSIELESTGSMPSMSSDIDAEPIFGRRKASIDPVWEFPLDFDPQSISAARWAKTEHEFRFDELVAFLHKLRPPKRH